jgi:hypothetical protein
MKTVSPHRTRTIIAERFILKKFSDETLLNLFDFLEPPAGFEPATC